MKGKKIYYDKINVIKSNDERPNVQTVWGMYCEISNNINTMHTTIDLVQIVISLLFDLDRP